MSEASASPAATNNGTKSGKNHNGTIASRSTSTKNSSFDATQTTGPDAFSNAASIQSSSGQSPDSSSSSSPGSSSSSNSGSISQGGSTSTIKEKLENNNGIAAALARSLTRGVAIYFSRPVRLFRPSKVSGWTSLRGAATRDGASLTPSWILELVRSQGFLIIPRHFIPPLIVNTLLGAVLWESYSYSSEFLEKHIPHHPILMAASSGAFAGACQSLMAAPAENVRIILEAATHTGHFAHPGDDASSRAPESRAKAKGKVKASAIDPVKEILGKPSTLQSHHTGWGHAWRRVFQGDAPLATANTRDDVRQLQRWAQDIKGMAGRGWDGWAWGCGKDMCGFALFFSVFELSRKIASNVAYITAEELDRLRLQFPNSKVLPASDKGRQTTARIAQGVTLVGGGVVAGLSYEAVARPFDNARKLVYLHDQHQRMERDNRTGSSANSKPKTARKVLEAKSRAKIVARVILDKIRTDGLEPFFTDPQKVLHVTDSSASSTGRGLQALLRTLGRVGPWGVGFLLYESLGGQFAQL